MKIFRNHYQPPTRTRETKSLPQRARLGSKALKIPQSYEKELI